jgi:hypothetical protein
MANYWMQLIRVTEVSNHWNSTRGDRSNGLPDVQQKTYRPVEGAPAQQLSAQDLEAAKREAAEHWQGYPQALHSEGYWIVEAERGCQYIYDHVESLNRQLAKARSF